MRFQDTDGNKLNAIFAVEQTIRNIQQSLNDNHTLDKLSESVRLSTRHYSRIFRNLTGQSPIDYLIGQRIERAKQLLRDSEPSIQTIATATGFRDPFHFSRSFKQHTGVSPTLYSQMRKTRIRVASLQFLGELLTLGIKPVGAPSQLLGCRYYRDYISGIEEIAETVVTPYLDKLALLKPDVIVTFNGHHYADYAKIAPTLDIPWSVPFFDRFRMLADLTGRAETAEAWIEHYGVRTADRRTQLSPYINQQHTVSLLWMKGLPATFQIYYDAEVIYRDLKLRAPSVIAGVREQMGHPFKEDIPLKDLSSYAGDHLFVVVSSDAQSEAQFKQLAASPQWLELPAVRNNRVYRITEDWLREDPISMMRQVQDAVQMIHAAGTQS